MKFRLTFNRTGKQRMLPMDYQYYIGAWIYKVIGHADREFAEFLHGQGYSDGNKNFKHFCYSPLDFGKPAVWKEKALFEINQNQATLKVSFALGEAAEKFIIGLFNNQQVYLGDRFNGIDFTVAQIERLPDPVFGESMVYRAASPAVFSFLPENKKYATYLSPEDEEYKTLAENHLKQKYQTLPGATPLPAVPRFGFRLLGKPKSKLITVKPYTPQESKIRGYIFDFRLTAPVEIHRMVFATGFGEKNATGFGWVEALDKGLIEKDYEN